MKTIWRNTLAISVAAYAFLASSDPLDDALSSWQPFVSSDWSNPSVFEQYYQSADWEERREFELAMVKASYTEYILDNISFTNALYEFLSHTNNEELRREGQFALSELLLEVADPSEQTNAPIRWRRDVFDFMDNPSCFTNTWLPYLEAGLLICDEIENGRAEQGYNLGTNLLHFSETVPCTSDSLLWHRYKNEIGEEPITAIDGIRLATAYAAKHCGEYAAASNLVSSYSSVEQQLLWIPDNAVIEVVETNGLVRIVDP